MPTPPNKTEFDALAAERSELDLLTEKGLVFTTPKQSWLRFFGTPTRSWLIQQPYLGTLDYLGREFIDLDFEEDLAKTPLPVARRMAVDHAKRCARIVAIAWLNSQWGIRWGVGLMSWYFRWHVTPTKLLQLAMLLNTMSNLADFIGSIRLMSVAPRTTTPVRVEQPAPTLD